MNNTIANLEYQWASDNQKLELLKSTICKGATNEEFQLFIHVCQHTKLDPFLKQVYPVFRDTWNAQKKERVKTMTIQTGIDGFRVIAERTGRYAPGREPTYEYKDGQLLSATAYVKKMTADGTWHEVAASAFFSEYVQRFKGKDGFETTGQFWESKPHLMLAKCAEALALRKAFPADLSGVYTQEEMMQADNKQTVEPAKELLTQAQMFELEDILAECSEDYQRVVRAGMVKRGMTGIKDITLDQFESTKQTFIEARERNKTLKEQEICI